MSKLVLAEKPSVARSIAKVLGANNRCDGYLEGNDYIVSWCLGHLVELAAPEAYDEKYGKWRLEDLPILPDDWIYQVSASTRKQYGILKELMKRSDVDSLICATDAGREGELIFRLVYHQAGCRKPFERLWISSMEDEAIREGFRNLRPGTEYDALYEAALCRERADWIVGMNATRLFSCLYGSTLNVGRVMTPTLAMVVMRDAEIAAFKPKPFYSVQINFGNDSATSRRFDTKEAAEQLLAKCKETMKAVVKTLERKEKTERPPFLYDLTGLQRDANRILGFTAKQTMDYTQSLYEKKLVTYPRTDSRYLTEDMKAMLPDLVKTVADKYSVSNKDIDPAENDQVFNNKKVTDHHAIIPTRSMPSADLSALPAGERDVLQLIAVRLMCAVAGTHRYAEDLLVVLCGDEAFTRKSKTILWNGWKDIEEHFYTAKQKEDQLLDGPVPAPGDTLSFKRIELKEGKTTAPKRFTEDSLLAGMEHAGAEEMPGDAERKGLGTPATRAGIIEKLVQKGFLRRKGDKKTKYLVSTDKGNALVTVMPEQIQSASMTADWEQKLHRMERNDYASEDFMREITEMITDLIGNYEVVKGAETLMSGHDKFGICPCCKSDVIEKPKGWFCSNEACNFALWKDNHFFKSIGKTLSASVAEKLLAGGRISLKGCKSRKTGKTYNATLLLSADETGKAAFKLEFEPKERQEGERNR